MSESSWEEAEKRLEKARIAFVDIAAMAETLIYQKIPEEDKRDYYERIASLAKKTYKDSFR